MADLTLDVDQLTESQQEVLQTYTSVTAQEPSAAIPLLQRSQWNVQIAIAKFFDGEAPDPVEEARAALRSSQIPSEFSRRETLLDGSSSFPRSSTSSSHGIAPRIVPQPENRSVYKPPLILSILLTPFNLLYRILSGSLGLFGALFPFLPRLLTNLSRRSSARGSQTNSTGRRPLNPRDTAARFVREFEEEYGSHDLNFFEDGYAQAYDLAKKDLKFLLVVLISPEHDDTDQFVRETLLSPELTAFVNNPQNNTILWAGNVQDSEAYQVSNALNCTKFPFASLLVHIPQDSSSSMSAIARIAGLMSPSAFVAKLQNAMSQHSPALERTRQTRSEQEASRNLRQEQNSAYERSLAQDRERARQRREAGVARERAEHEAKLRVDATERVARQIETWRIWKAQHIAPEPGADAKDATRISIRMPSGDRIIRKFAPQTSIEELYAFVECHEMIEKAPFSPPLSQPLNYDHQYKFNLVSPMPRMVYDLDSGGTLGERIGRSGNLIVESVLEEEE